jgi:RNA polymerase sigma-70 factor (ECF subfamily)
MEPGSAVLAPAAVGVAVAAPIVADVMDETAFHAFYRRTARPLWAYVRRATGDPALADDLVQTAFCRLLGGNVPELGEEELRAYLFRIASNLVVDHWRRAGRAQAPPPAPAPEGTADERMVARLDMARTLDRLAPRERALLWLAYVEGSSHREIAGSLGVKEASVKVLLFRARQQLAKLLGRSGPGTGGR